MIRVVLVDDHPALRAGVAAILNAEPDVQVVGATGDGKEAVPLIESLQPDVVLLDMDLPGMSGMAIAHQIRAVAPTMAVLGFSAHADPVYVQALVAAGAAGYLTKDEPPERICAAIRSVGAGETGWLSRSVAAVLMHAQRQAGAETSARFAAPAPLTAREQSVLSLLAQGKTNAEIAQALGASVGTVKNHVHNIMAKLRVQSRGEAVAWAWRHGIDGM
jgi:DNA-binding NarL/FixJ family response regulator